MVVDILGVFEKSVPDFGGCWNIVVWKWDMLYVYEQTKVGIREQ